VRRLRSLVAAVVIGLLSIAPVGAASGDDASLVDVGRSLGRALLIFRNARTCAPVVRIQICIDDLSGYFGTTDGNARLGAIAGAGPKPYDRLLAYITDGDPANIDPVIGWSNVVSSPKSDGAREGQLKDAGIASTLIGAANGIAASEVPAFPPAFDAAQRPAQDDLDLFSPEDRSLLVSLAAANTSQGPFIVRKANVEAVTAAASAFAQHADARFPAHAAPDFRYDKSPAGYLRLGVAFVTVREYLELPQLSTLPESRAFSTQAIARIVQLAPVTASSGAVVITGLASNDDPTRHAGADAMKNLYLPLFAAIGDSATEEFTLGTFVAQMGFNAGTVRNSQTVDAVVAMAAKIPMPSDMPPEYASKIKALRSCAGTDFACQRRTAKSIVDALMKP
jgi:hypothetical protein